MAMKFEVENTAPDFSLWEDLLKKNVSTLESNIRPWTPEEKQSLRNKVIQIAQAFTKEIDSIAKKLLKDNSAFKETQQSSGIKIVAAGHQPIIYHSGISYKNHLLERLCNGRNDLIGLNVIIDTDVGDAGKIHTLAKENSNLQKIEFNIANQNTLYLNNKILTTKSVNEEFSRFTEALNRLGLEEFARKAKEYSNYYQALSGHSIIEANTAIRRISEDFPSYLEVPLSKLIEISEIQSFFIGLIADSKNFVSTYNASLDEFRRQQKIKNPANPFPNLTVNENESELPFWLISKTSLERHALFIGFKGEKLNLRAGSAIFIETSAREIVEKLKTDFILAPKASLITIILRLGLSDLFIHGTGGAKYDEFTDLFISNYFKITPPKFCLATASNYLLKTEVAEYEKAKSESFKRRDMRFHVEKYLLESVFLPDIRAKLQNLIEEKKSSIEKIKEGKAKKESTAEPTQRVKQIEGEIGEILENVLGPVQEFREPSKTYLDLIYFREAPSFIFS